MLETSLRAVSSASTSSTTSRQPRRERPCVLPSNHLGTILRQKDDEDSCLRYYGVEAVVTGHRTAHAHDWTRPEWNTVCWANGKDVRPSSESRPLTTRVSEYQCALAQ